MSAFATGKVAATSDGIAYASANPLTGTEVDLFNGAGFDPVPLPYQNALAAAVELTLAGSPSGNTTYVVLQTDLGDGVWFDVAWAVLTSTGNAVYSFLLSAGVAGANAFQQSRAVGTAPGSTGSNQCALGARIRFVGKTTLTGGTAPSVTATIRYKLTPMR